MRILEAALLALVGTAAAARAQYHNLDAGRPGRIEDAEVTALYALDVDLAPITGERLNGGTFRLRTEPKLTYGVLPFTDLELRLPLVRIIPPRSSGAKAVSGVGGLAVGAMHTFNVETPSLPAFALGGEVSLPAGGLSSPQAAYLAKALLTRTTSFGRFHWNGGIGSYSVRLAQSPSDSSCTTSGFFKLHPSTPGKQDCSPPIIVDTPCELVSGGETASLCNGTPSSAATAATPTPKSRGVRWFTGLGFDRAIPLVSTVLTADVFAERYRGLYATTDWTAEAGVRHQVTPLLVVDAGIARHFAGTIQSSSVTLGASYELATTAWRR